jgi:hypothetical protein
MPTLPTPGALVSITTSAAAVGGETAVIIALHPRMALQEAVNADRDDGGVARAKRAYREHNQLVHTMSGLEFTTTADGINVTEHRSAPASVEVIAATRRAQSILERADTARDGCASVAGNVSHHDRRGIKRAADEPTNDTEPRWAPAGVELAAATEDDESTVERARTARDECAAVAGNGDRRDKHGIKRAAVDDAQRITASAVRLMTAFAPVDAVCRRK